MAGLWRIPDKWKALLVLIAGIVASAHQICTLLMRIFDNNELDLNEAVELAAMGKSQVEAWSSKRSADNSET